MLCRYAVLAARILCSVQHPAHPGALGDAANGRSLRAPGRWSCTAPALLQCRHGPAKVAPRRPQVRGALGGAGRARDKDLRRAVPLSARRKGRCGQDRTVAPTGRRPQRRVMALMEVAAATAVTAATETPGHGMAWGSGQQPAAGKAAGRGAERAGQGQCFRLPTAFTEGAAARREAHRGRGASSAPSAASPRARGRRRGVRPGYWPGLVGPGRRPLAHRKRCLAPPRRPPRGLGPPPRHPPTARPAVARTGRAWR